MRADLALWRDQKAAGMNSFPWKQYPLHSEERKDRWDDVMIPAQDSGSFSKKLSQIIGGDQFQSIMSLVSCPDHTDDFDDFKDTALLIPYKIGPCHWLEVEGERFRMKPMHVYAFNHKRYHRLAYCDKFGREDEMPSSMVASVLNVSFYKKGFS
jgi:hypothetical protein